MAFDVPDGPAQGSLRNHGVRLEFRSAKLSRQPTRAGERGTRRLNSPTQAQRFLGAHAVVYSLFSIQRYPASAASYRLSRTLAFDRWNAALAA